MGLNNLDKIFHPDSIAVVGASEKRSSIGRAVMTNLIDGGFDGNLFAVNPNYDHLYDRQAYAQIADTPDTPDVAVIAIPMPMVPDVVDDCGRIGVKGAVILSAGGREAGAEGRRRERTIQASARRSGLRIIGPNCLGIICPQNKLNASFAAHMPPSGNLAFISQSGAICSAMLDLSLQEKMGYRYFISVGSMLDVDFGDLIDFVGNDPKVSSVLLYIESLSQETIEKLDQVLPAHWSRGNPIDILGDADAQRHIDALECLDAKAADGLLTILNPQAMIDPAEVAATLTDALGKAPFSVFASWMGGRDVEQGTAILNAAGIPTYATPEQAVQAFRYLCDYAQNITMLQEIPPRIEHRIDVDRGAAESILARGLERKNGLLTEFESKDVLKAYGIPVNPTRLAESKTAAEKMAPEIGFPLAMKIASWEITHKRRAGGVKLGLDSVAAVSQAYETIMRQTEAAGDKAQVQGVTLQPMQSMPHDMLARFTQIDYDREIALVALEKTEDDTRMLGIARVMDDSGGDQGEFAVLIADPWQGKGLGGELLSRALRIVRRKGMQRVWGTALVENTHMAKLARRLGFTVKRDASGDYEMTMDLKTADGNTND
jgi:acyl-CoA synthetase (NDP forming)/predicted GNAT family N-acyltransferase